jgi:hypothetical protein
MTDNESIQERLDRLETLVENQQETIEQQRERIAQLEGGDPKLSAPDEPQVSEDDESSMPVSRRGTLAALAGAGILGTGAIGSASAQEAGCSLGRRPNRWRRGVDARGNLLANVCGITTDDGLRAAESGESGQLVGVNGDGELVETNESWSVVYE